MGCRLASSSHWLRDSLFESRQPLLRAGSDFQVARHSLRWGGCGSLPARYSLVDLQRITCFHKYISSVRGKSESAARSYSRCLVKLCKADGHPLEQIAQRDFHPYVRDLPCNKGSQGLLSATVRHFAAFYLREQQLIL